MKTRARIVITIALLGAAGATFWLRERSTSGPDEADRVAAGGSTEVVTSERMAQLPTPPPQLPDVPVPGEEERKLPDGWDVNVRSAPAESVTMRMPAAGEEAPVRAYRFVPGEQPPPTQPPNPFVPAKQHLSEDDLRAGLPVE